jgi:hypothetical protein
MRMQPPISIAIACMFLTQPATGQSRSWSTDILKQTFHISKQSQIDTKIADVHQGCQKRDCFPSIDEPGFASATHSKYLDDDDLILGLSHKGVVRAYPAFILNHHEIVNDTVAGDPVVITFCPLCGSGVAFRRELKGEVVEFGVSGLLHNSDLILYDRTSNSLWQQITGQAVSGPHRGDMLEVFPLSMTTWKEWREAYPDTDVLVSDGGKSLVYSNKSPYGDYDQSKRLMFPANSAAARILHPKLVVHGVRIPEGAAAISDRAWQEKKEIITQTGGITLTWHKQTDGSVQVKREDNGEVLTPHRMFWFAWYSFNTDTEIYDPKLNESGVK